MKESTIELVQALYNLGYTNVDVINNGKIIPAKDIVDTSKQNKKKDKKRKKRK